jgi:hypothetical protein
VIHFMPGQLFRRHVVECPGDVADTCQIDPPGTRDPEIQHFHDARFADHDVGRLDVAVNDRRAVGVVECRTQHFEDAQLFGESPHAAPRDQLRQCLARHVLHRDERTIVVFADVVNRDDVGMVEAASRSRLARESFARHRIVEPLFEELDGDEAFDRGVARKVERAHPAVRDQPCHVVASNGRRRLRHPRAHQSRCGRVCCRLIGAIYHTRPAFGRRGVSSS